LTKVADRNVAATPMKAHNPLKPPITDGLTPVEQYGFLELAWNSKKSENGLIQ